MTTWWMGLSLREKGLILSAALITTLVILWQAIIVPTTSWRAAALDRSESAMGSLQSLQEAYFRERAVRDIIVVASEKPAQLTGEPFKSEIVRAASDSGLAISRLQTSGPNIVGITIDSADPRIVFFWLQEVELRAGGNITRLILESLGNEQVRVSVDFQSVPV